VQVEVFTAGATSTQRNEGINKHAKANLGKRASLVKVVKELTALAAHQAERSLLETVKAQMPYKEAVTIAEHTFGPAFVDISNKCSPYAKAKMVQQASFGISTYGAHRWDPGVCPEDSLEQVGTDDHLGVNASDQCDSFRCSSAKAVVEEKRLQSFLCYSVQPHATGLQKNPPQTVILYDKDKSSTQYLNFFCTCGESIRCGSLCPTLSAAQLGS
jgi:hypothetical protein